MTSEEAIAYLNSQQQTSDSHPEQSSPSEDTKPTEAGPGEAIKTPEPETAVDTGREPEDTKVPENKPEEVPPTKKKPSRQEQINHAFQRNKQKFKAELEAKDKRIAELEEKVKKYSVLEQGDFDPNDVKSYIDHLRQLDKEQAELDTLKAERTKMVNEDRMNEATERHARQVDSCFSSDEEKAHYWNLLRNGGDKFREFLNEYDDGTIDQFIGDSDIAPVLISTLMRNPEVLKSIVEKRNPMRKMIALQQLETRLNLARKVGAARTSQGAPETKPTAKLPITGSQVSNPGSSGESSARDWNRYLQEHPRGT